MSLCCLWAVRFILTFCRLGLSDYIRERLIERLREEEKKGGL